MAIQRVEITDFLVFRGEFLLEFCPGINVLIGENGTGKSTLMKILYWACEFADKSDFDPSSGGLKLEGNPEEPIVVPFLLKDYFGKRNTKLSYQTKAVAEEYTSVLYIVESARGEGDMEAALRVVTSEALDSIQLHVGQEYPKESQELALWCNRKFPTVFIPTAEMLSHSRGLLALSRERSIPFDKTEIDIIAKAQLEPTHELTPNAAIILDRLALEIGGTVSFEDQDFYINKKELGSKVAFSFEASGYRKLGLLWKLLRNGLLEVGTILYWDEPENSLNPKMLPILVDILLELSRNGVQIFVATHSEIFAGYFAVNRKNGDHVSFISLYKDKEQIKASVSDRFDLLEPNNLTAEPVKLYEKEIERGLGGDG